MKRTILIVDDEQDMCQLLKRSLEPELHCRVETAISGEAAMESLSGTLPDLVLADIKMPGMDGLELLEKIKDRWPDLTVVMMTAFGQIETAVEAMRRGAYDFITKPFEHDALVMGLEKALERSQLLRENLRLQHECREVFPFQNMVGQSAAMKKFFEAIRTVAKTDLTVLITGESGTGKELTARAVHARSLRRRGPFVAVNCPTVPEHILESELFGYKKGAFTHATQNRIGLFQEADKGTIFLDEIGDISPTMQTKLLRVLQEKEIKPLGDTRTLSVDVRIVASTNQDLKAKIDAGAFREDFFYRLNVLPLQLPPLRERPEDIPLIADHLLKKNCCKLGHPLKRFSPALMNVFMKRPWVGNVREMENLIVQGILFSTGDQIGPGDIGVNGIGPQPPCPELPIERLPYKAAKENCLARFNADYIARLLSENDGNVTRAAKACGLERQALQQIMRRYEIRSEGFKS